MITADQELKSLSRRKADSFWRAIARLAKARWEQSEDLQPARESLARLLMETQILADMLGRRRGMLEMNTALKGAKFEALQSPIITGVKFEEAIQNILNREPMLSWGWQQAAHKYTMENGFTLAKSMEGIIDKQLGKARVKLVQQALVSEKVQAGGIQPFREAMKEIGPWTRNYADTVYKTNLSSAYTEGRFEQAKDPDVSQVIKALEVTKSTAVNPRDNHKGFEGLLAAPDDPIWQKAKPPFGYNCTHGVRFVSIFELERRGRLKDGKVVPYYPPGLARASYDRGFNPRVEGGA